jgi:hypothetical protein
MKLTSVERIGRSQLIPGVRRIERNGRGARLRRALSSVTCGNANNGLPASSCHVAAAGPARRGWVDNTDGRYCHPSRARALPGGRRPGGVASGFVRVSTDVASRGFPSEHAREPTAASHERRPSNKGMKLTSACPSFARAPGASAPWRSQLIPGVRRTVAGAA